MPTVTPAAATRRRRRGGRGVSAVELAVAVALLGLLALVGAVAFAAAGGEDDADAKRLVVAAVDEQAAAAAVHGGFTDDPELLDAVDASLDRVRCDTDAAAGQVSVAVAVADGDGACDPATPTRGAADVAVGAAAAGEDGCWLAHRDHGAAPGAPREAYAFHEAAPTCTGADALELDPATVVDADGRGEHIDRPALIGP